MTILPTQFENKTKITIYGEYRNGTDLPVAEIKKTKTGLKLTEFITEDSITIKNKTIEDILELGFRLELYSEYKDGLKQDDNSRNWDKFYTELGVY